MGRVDVRPSCHFRVSLRLVGVALTGGVTGWCDGAVEAGLGGAAGALLGVANNLWRGTRPLSHCLKKAQPCEFGRNPFQLTD